jgi:NAD(P)-dependent dehydrogenase (short-subunit alcohol dehydrogenase family)
MDLEGRTAIVTGAASGIGRALSMDISDRGGRLVLVDRDPVGLQRTADDTGGTAVPLDVASPDEHERLAEEAGTPTLLCLNAGVTSPAAGPVWEASPEEWRRVLDINLGGVVNGLRTFVPRMLATGEVHHILITASLAGLATWPGGGPYAASKHAVVVVAEQAALALADTPVTVTLLCPALVRSGMSEIGDDPAAVAGQALEAVGRGTFAVVPDDWTAAVGERGTRLASGHQPIVPAPSA